MSELDTLRAAVERVRAIHKPEPTGRAEYVKNENGGITGTAETFVCPRGCNGSVWFFAGDECDTYKAAALDGAPEPEVEWEYARRGFQPNVILSPDESYAAAARRVELAGRDPLREIVRRRPAGPWEVCK